MNVSPRIPSASANTPSVLVKRAAVLVSANVFPELANLVMVATKRELAAVRLVQEDLAQRQTNAHLIAQPAKSANTEPGVEMRLPEPFLDGLDGLADFGPQRAAQRADLGIELRVERRRAEKKRSGKCA